MAGRRAPQPPGEASSVHSSSTVPGPDPVRRRGAAEGPRVLARLGPELHDVHTAIVAELVTGLNASRHRRNPARAHRRSPGHRAEPVHGDPAACTTLAPPAGQTRCCSRVGARGVVSVEPISIIPAGPPAPAAAALVRPHVPALGRRPGGSRRLPPAPSRHLRRDDVRRAGPVPDGGHRVYRPAVPWAGRSWRQTCASTPSTRPVGVVSSSSASTRPPRGRLARAVFGLPYRWARMGFSATGERATPRRCGGRGRPAARRDPGGRPGADGPLERFLTARWGLHVARSGRTGTSPTPTRLLAAAHGRNSELDDGLVAAAGGWATSPRARPTTSGSQRGRGGDLRGGRVPATRPRPGSCRWPVLGSRRGGGG